jgi:hypothetical protein
MKSTLALLLSFFLAFPPTGSFAQDATPKIKDRSPFFIGANGALEKLVRFIEVEHRVTKIGDTAPGKTGLKELLEKAKDASEVEHTLESQGPSIEATKLSETQKQYHQLLVNRANREIGGEITPEEEIALTAMMNGLLEGLRKTTEEIENPYYKTYLFEFLDSPDVEFPDLRSQDVDRSQLSDTQLLMEEREDARIKSNRENDKAVAKAAVVLGVIGNGAREFHLASKNLLEMRQAQLNRASEAVEHWGKIVRNFNLPEYVRKNAGIELDQALEKAEELRTKPFVPDPPTYPTVMKPIPRTNIKIPLNFSKFYAWIDRKLFSYSGKFRKFFVNRGKGSGANGMKGSLTTFVIAASGLYFVSPMVSSTIRNGATIDVPDWWILKRIPTVTIPGTQSDLKARDITWGKYNPWDRFGNLSLAAKDVMKQAGHWSKDHLPNQFHMCRELSRGLRDLVPAYQADAELLDSGRAPVHLNSAYQRLSQARKKIADDVVGNLMPLASSRVEPISALRFAVKEYAKVCTLKFYISPMVWQDVRNQYIREHRPFSSMKFSHKGDIWEGNKMLADLLKKQGIKETDTFEVEDEKK